MIWHLEISHYRGGCVGKENFGAQAGWMSQTDSSICGLPRENVKRSPVDVARFRIS